MPSQLFKAKGMIMMTMTTTMMMMMMMMMMMIGSSVKAVVPVKFFKYYLGQGHRCSKYHMYIIVRMCSLMNI